MPATPNTSAQGTSVPDPTLLRTTILLLVSDPLVRSVLQDTLEHGGYTVVTAGDMGSAVDRLKEITPDLLITRTYVEGMTGHDAATYLRTKSNGLRVLMVGGLLDDQRLKNRESMEGFDVFPKPYSPRELLQTVKNVLHKQRA
jgi:two-component system, cell cycle sensor histidine kinase and response regulator CckA